MDVMLIRQLAGPFILESIRRCLHKRQAPRLPCASRARRFGRSTARAFGAAEPVFRFKPHHRRTVASPTPKRCAT
jgi:hypothetical protein